MEEEFGIHKFYDKKKTTLTGGRTNIGGEMGGDIYQRHLELF